MKRIKFTKCHECGTPLDLGDSAVEYDSDIFCDRDCIMAHIEKWVEEIEVEEQHCDHEEDYTRE